MILYINACVREESRTRRLAEHLLAKLKGSVKEVRTAEIHFPTVDADFLRWRDGCIARADYADVRFDLAKDFAAAEEIVVAAPFWDLSFPAALKQYLEQVTVLGLTFTYTEAGIPRGLCRAERLHYVTTAGGPILSGEYGCGYVRALAQGFFGIPETVFYKAEGLDMIGADVEEILAEAKERVHEKS